ncbi:T9SS type A sorting domain-containing protein [Cyclobacteriaceae bacterium]|nr:T9SS type A sorting domain-containing protein [Cyclobacteriaceae bacterium]
MRNILSSIVLFWGVFVSAQVVHTEITTWKNDARGAYNLIHDDYGSSVVDGIWQYADTIAHNRGLTFTIGAITQHCEASRNVLGYSSPYEYAKKVMVPIHGHEIINHTHTHSCALNMGGGSCSKDWTVEDIEYELGVSTTSIFDNTGYYPQYLIFPYDQFQDLCNQFLKEEVGYIGSRSGWTSNQSGSVPYHRYGYDKSDNANFFPDADGYFRTAVVVKVYDASDGKGAYAQELNAWAQTAIDNGVWVNRELHNVGSNGWGRVSVADYRDHLDFLKQSVDNNDLWVGTVSEILTYQAQKLGFTTQGSYSAANHSVVVSFNETSSFDITNYLADLSFKSPVTVKVDLSAYTDLSGLVIVQNSDTIQDYRIENNVAYVNMYPHEGSVRLLNIDGITTSLDHVYNTQKLVLSPNPSASQFSISSAEHIASVEVYNNQGALVMTSAELTFGEQLLPGAYHVVIIFDDLSSQNHKVVKL